MPTNEPLFSTLRFVSSTGQLPGGKRKIAQHACDRCRRRKKRCFHGHNAVSDTDNGVEASEVAASTRSGNADGNQRLGDERAAALPQPRGSQIAATSHTRYIGDLNPEVELLSATASSQVPKNSTGVWHSDSLENTHDNGEINAAAPGSILHGFPPETQKSLLPALQSQCYQTRPPKEDFLELERYYFERVHSVLPSIDRLIYRNSADNSATRILQEQSICLLASISINMRQHLRLGNATHTLVPTEYARRVVSAMRVTIDLALVSDKVVLIYALTTMSLFVYGRESLELTSQYFFRAVQLAYTIGLHQPGDVQQNERVAGLFSYLWSVDRIHAAIQGRPVVMHEVDMAKCPLSCAVNQEAGFKVLVHIAALLDKVIGLYRPTAHRKEIPDEDFRSYQEILEDCNALTIRACDQALLELFYHAVSVLSCRYSSGATPEGYHARNARQSSSAAQILAIMDDFNTTNTAMLPFVSYGVSLAMSTAYHQFRHGKVTTQRERAWKDFVRSHNHLAPLGAISWSAAFMSDLATKLIHQARSRRETGASSPILETDQNPQAVVSDQAADINVVGFPMDGFMTDLNLNLDGLFEGALDPSMPWQFDDTSYAGAGW